MVPSNEKNDKRLMLSPHGHPWDESSQALQRLTMHTSRKSYRHLVDHLPFRPRDHYTLAAELIFGVDIFR